MSVARLAGLGARTIADANGDLQHRFAAITKRAKLRHETRDWTGMAADAAERLDLYGAVAWETADSVAALLDDRLHDKTVWAAMKMPTRPSPWNDRTSSLPKLSSTASPDAPS